MMADFVFTFDLLDDHTSEEIEAPGDTDIAALLVLLETRVGRSLTPDDWNLSSIVNPDD